MTSGNNSQRGFSLVELLIALALGVMMLGAASLLMLSNRATFLAVDSSSRIQENARFALGMMAEHIRMAGYFDPAAGSPSNFMFTDECDGLDPCTGNGVGTASDWFAVMLNPPTDNEIDCTGAATNANDTYANVFLIVNNGGVRSLVCRGFNTTTGAWNAAAQPLVDGIDRMQVQYGIVDDDEVVSYVSADRVTNWGEIRSVRINLLVSDGGESGSADLETRSYDMLDAGTVAVADRYERKLFTTTVVINNAFF
jgi:type IV pilus assembly protein PilW